MKGNNITSEDCGDLDIVNKRECQLAFVKKSKEEESNLKVKLTEVKVTEQPPLWLKRGDMFNFTVQVLRSSINIENLSITISWLLKL